MPVDHADGVFPAVPECHGVIRGIALVKHVAGFVIMKIPRGMIGVRRENEMGYCRQLCFTV